MSFSSNFYVFASYSRRGGLCHTINDIYSQVAFYKNVLLETVFSVVLISFPQLYFFKGNESSNSRLGCNATK